MNTYDLLSTCQNNVNVVIRNQFNHVLATGKAVDVRMNQDPKMLAEQPKLISVEKNYLVIYLFI